MSQLLRQGMRELGLGKLSSQAERDLLWLLNELLRWNRHHNLTAIDDLSSGIEKHLVDSLTLLPDISGSERLLDIGSGAGFPGLALKIASPGLHLVSIDGVAKKIRFQRQVIRQLKLTNTTAIDMRLEALLEDKQYLGSFDLIVFRALGRLDKFVPLALPCLAENGRFLVMKGPEGDAEWAAAAVELQSLGIDCVERREYRLPNTGAQRTVLILTRKIPKIL